MGSDTGGKGKYKMSCSAGVEFFFVWTPVLRIYSPVVQVTVQIECELGEQHTEGRIKWLVNQGHR